jgi:hypothetical protein
MGSFIAGAVWVGLAYKYLRKDGADVWQMVAMNFGLLVPAVFMVGWTMRQYGRERQFHEEYAFRSSVAMTLSAFADRLEGTSDGRSDLIRQTVERLYQMPLELSPRPRGLLGFRSKTIQDIAKAAVETHKEAKG